MGSALARSICRIKEIKVYISDSNLEKAKAFCVENGAEISDNISIVKNCDYIFLAVKPNAFEAVLSPLKNAFSENKDSVVVTMAAGLSINRVEELLCEAHPIIRIMPNTPAAVGEGMITWCKNELVTESSAKEFEGILKYAGQLDAIDEKLIDAASAVAGCGPAFAYMFIEALADGAVLCGLPRDKAIAYAAKTLRGAASMVLDTGKHPEQLKDEVCSPGGTTIEGVAALEKGAFRADASSAVVAAFEKTKKMG